MRRIQLAAELNLPVSAVWELFADIENYPRYVKFMRSVELKGKPGLGTIWYDWTTILFLPMKIRHQVVKFEKEEEIAFEVSSPLGGMMWQVFRMAGDQKKAKVEGEISFDLGNFLLDFFLGFFLKLRLNDMLRSTLSKIRKETDGRDN